MGELLITGAAGRIGRQLRPRLTRRGHHLRLLDAADQDAPARGEPVRIIRADVTDPVAMADACSGVDAVLHLAALAGEDTWERLLRINVEGTRSVLEAARAAGVPRVILASSIQAAGFYRRPGSDPRPHGVAAPAGPDGVPATALPRPSGFYGWSKAAGESLGSLYADRFGLTVFAVRIGACFPEPPGRHGREVWLSPDDCARLVSACLTAEVTGFRVLWGTSRNTRRWLSLTEGREIGYDPADNGETYAGAVDEPPSAVDGLLGDHFCTSPLGVPDR